MKKLAILFLLMPFCCAHAQCGAMHADDAAKTYRYVLVLQGTNAGFQTTTVNADGSLQVHFEFNDRGRGPSINSHFVLDKSGVLAAMENTGNDYMKAQVGEHFALVSGKAVWKNRAEQGEKQAAGRAYYVSLTGTPEDGAQMVRALLLAPGQSLPLLPSGQATLQKRSEMKLDVAGKPHTFTLYEISGLDFTPSPFWLIDDGKTYASIASWSSLVPEGFESVVAPLLKAQDKLQEDRSGELARTLAHKPAGALVFTHARLFDSETAQSRPNSTVVITGNRITAIGADGKVAIPKNAEVIDAAGKTLMPGLWDMHVHIQPNDGLLHMAAGVTSVRDLANDTDALMKLRERFSQGTEIGPRVVMAGFIDGRGPYQGPTKVFADNEEEAKKAVDNYARLGYVQIKVYSSLKPELVPKIAQMAHDHGMRLSGHVPSGMIAEQFIRAGADEMQHMNFVFLNFMPQVKDTRTPARFTEVAAHGAEIDPASDQVKAFIRLLQEHKTVLDPTLAIFEGLITDRPGVMSAGFATVANRMPAQIRRGFLYGGLAVPEGQDQRYKDSFQQMLKMAKAFYDAGIPIVAGTDSLAGFSLHRELVLYEAAGIPAPKVLQLATLGAARVMKLDKELGSIAPGKLADVILVDGDPAAHIADIYKVKTVVKDGVVYQAADLDRALGVKPL
jgi:imidazolonepropionase-like amidohydrolase